MAPRNRTETDSYAALTSAAVSGRAWRYSKTDVILAGLGGILAVGSTLLPWYIFLHQDQFGIRALKFESGETGAAGGAGISPSSRASEEPLEADAQPQPAELDVLATGTPQPRTGNNPNPPGLAEQPFPAGASSEFRLLHVANGRALVEDEHGIWLVQTGSFLPDNSRIAAIEERDGRWVIVTNTERVIEIVR